MERRERLSLCYRNKNYLEEGNKEYERIMGLLELMRKENPCVDISTGHQTRSRSFSIPFDVLNVTIRAEPENLEKITSCLLKRDKLGFPYLIDKPNIIFHDGEKTTSRGYEIFRKISESYHKSLENHSGFYQIY